MMSKREQAMFFAASKAMDWGARITSYILSDTPLNRHSMCVQEFQNACGEYRVAAAADDDPPSPHPYVGPDGVCSHCKANGG